MSPETIPWLLCGAICILPLLIGIGSYFAMIQITSRFPLREVSTWTDKNKRKHTQTEWSWQTREDKKFRDKEDKEE